MSEPGLQSGGGQRRFRQRGGAKKKKRPRKESDAPGSTVHDFTAPDLNTLPCPSLDQMPASVRPFESNKYSDRHGKASYNGAANNAVHGQPAPVFESQLDPGLVQYLSQLRDDLQQMQFSHQQHEDDPEEEPPSLMLARNGLSSLTPNLHEVCLEPLGSRVLEMLIQAAAADPDCIADTLSAILALGSHRVAILADHRCGSHVLQSLVVAVTGDAAVAGGGSTSQAKALEMLGQMLSDWSLEDLMNVMSSSCGSHVFRAIVAGLAGLPAEEPKEAKLDDSTGSDRIVSYITRLAIDVPKEWMISVVNLAERLLEADETGDGLHSLVWTASSCAAFQGLLSAVTHRDRKLARRLVKATVQNKTMEICFDACGARFMERVVICLGAAEVLPAVKGQVAAMAKDSKANFVVQRILLGLKGRGQVVSAWDELEPALAGMVGYGSTRDGVVLAMLRAAEVEGDEQARRRASRAIGKAIGAAGPSAKHLCGILLTGSIDRWERWRDGVKAWTNAGMGIPIKQRPEDDQTAVLRIGGGMPSVSLLGVLMARSVMRYPGAPGQAARDSMGNLTAPEILALCSLPAGSRLVEQWIESDEEHGTGKAITTVLSAVLDIRDNAGAIGAMCRSPYGAQILIRIVPRVSGDMRKRSMEALGERAAVLSAHVHGRQVIRKCRVHDFLRHGDEWSTAESARDTRARVFADLLHLEETAPPDNQIAGAIDDNGTTPVVESTETPVIVANHTNDTDAGVKLAEAAKAVKRAARKEGLLKRNAESTDGVSAGLENVLSAIAKAADGGKKSNKKRKRNV
jgi:hypothetical protein